MRYLGPTVRGQVLHFVENRGKQSSDFSLILNSFLKSRLLKMRAGNSIELQTTTSVEDSYEPRLPNPPTFPNKRKTIPFMNQSSPLYL